MNAFVSVESQTQHSFRLIEVLGCARQKTAKHPSPGAVSFHSREGAKETYSFLPAMNANLEDTNIWHCEWPP